MLQPQGGHGGGGKEEEEEFLDLCDKVKQMTEENARKRKREDFGGAASSGRPQAPSLVYGPIDWRVPPAKEKEIKEKAMRKVVVEEEEEMENEAVVEEEVGMEEVPKKKGKIKRRGKKKGKRNKPDREQEEETKKAESAMDC